MQRSYYYLGGDALHTGMYVALINRLEAEGLVVDLVSRIRLSLNPLASWRTWRSRRLLGPNPIDLVRRQIRGRVHTLPVWAPLPALSTPALARIVRACHLPDQRIIMHTRQIVMGRLALSLKRWCPALCVIPELEGDNLAESQYKQSLVARPSPLRRLSWWLEERFYFHHEKRLLRESDAVICVSHKLKDVMVQRYRLTAHQAKKIRVFPSVASRNQFHFSAAKRDSVRRALGLEQRFVVIYNGNLSGRWQIPDKLVKVFELIRQRRPDAFFLLLTPPGDWRHIKPHLERARLSCADYRLHSCQHRDVVDHLCAADVGLLLRDRHPMNEVAAPGKFAEYVLSGLPVVMTDGIGDFSEVAKRAECACVLPSLEDVDAMRIAIHRFCARSFTADQRAAFSQWGAERFAIELYVPQLASLYRSIEREPIGTGGTWKSRSRAPDAGRPT